LLFEGAACTSLTAYSKEDIQPYLGQRTAFFVLKPDDPLPPELWQQVKVAVEEGINASSDIAHLVHGVELKQFWKQHPELNQEHARYSSTLMLTHISDRNLATHLSQQLNVSQFFILQAENYPCSEKCASEHQLMIRFLLVDAATGDILYRIRFHEQLKDDAQEGEALQTLVLDVTEQMIQRFRSEFTTPWHRQRYENLKSS